jgi:hypothetical protein
MNYQIQSIDLAGAACQTRKAPSSHTHHLIHQIHTLPKALHVTAPIHWAHDMLHEIHAFHPLHRTNVWVHRLYLAHADHWSSTAALVAAVTSTSLLAYLLYLVLSATQITDYTTGVWPLFG